MTREEFDNQALPQSDANSNLETDSRNALRAMFSPNDFEFRDENQHDKGIDAFVEIKFNGKNTNLRFPVQLKATRTHDKNQDGSISFTVKVSNINYLLNDGMPAFYMLYSENEACFYYEMAQEVSRTLKEKYPNNDYPESFTIKFSKRLDADVIDNIHANMRSWGYLRRTLNEMLNLRGNRTVSHDILVVQEGQTVYNATEKVKFLETYGYHLLNIGSFLEILEIEKSCYPLLTDVSAVFHFVCGAAAHYTGKFYQSLEHFKKADKNLSGLHSEVQHMIRYYTLHAKLTLGMIDKEKCASYLDQLMDSEYLGLYLKMQKAYENYFLGELSETSFKNVINLVLADSRCDESMRLIAESYMLSADGDRLNDQLLDNLLKYRHWQETQLGDPEQFRLRTEQIDNYNDRIAELQNKAKEDKNLFTYHNVNLNSIRVNYIKTFYADVILGVDKKTLTFTSSLTNEEKERLIEQAQLVGRIAEVNEQISASENMISALSLQYELLHFLKDFDGANQVMKKMEVAILENDWHGLEEKIQKLKNGGTSHETFEEMVIKSLSKTNERNAEISRMEHEINQMNAEDSLVNMPRYESMISLHIFPLGIFCFEETLLERVFEVLHVTMEGKTSIIRIIKFPAIPILNIFNDPIQREGPVGGFAMERPDSIMRLHRVRKNLKEIGVNLVKSQFHFG
jgi:hypothetical protein